MPFSLIFPVIPWLLQLILFGWFVVVLAYPFWPSIPCHLSPLTCLNGYQWNTTGDRTLWWSSILRREEQICSQTTSLACTFLFSQHRSYNISQGNVLFIIYVCMCTCRRWHFKGTVSLRIITWYVFGKQNVQAKEAVLVSSRINQDKLQLYDLLCEFICQLWQVKNCYSCPV